MEKRQQAIMNYLRSEPVELPKDDLSVSITLHRLPATLVQLFAPKVAYQYPDGIGGAIEDLMMKSISE